LTPAAARWEIVADSTAADFVGTGLDFALESSSSDEAGSDVAPTVVD